MERPSKDTNKDDPLFCQLCHVRTNSFKLLSAHLSGKIHTRKLRDRTLLQQISLRTRKKAREKAAVGSNEQDVQFVQNPQTQAISDDLLFCSTCSLKLNSAEQMESHLLGSKHAKKAANFTNQEQPTQSSSCTSSLPDCIVPHESARQKGGFKCKTCNLFLNSVPQVVAHLSSDRHLMESTGNPVCPQVKASSEYNPSSAGHGAKFRQARASNLPTWRTNPPDSTALAFVKGGRL